VFLWMLPNRTSAYQNPLYLWPSVFGTVPVCCYPLFMNRKRMKDVALKSLVAAVQLPQRKFKWTITALIETFVGRVLSPPAGP
jgi:hypothetical protein